jgi:hypothetical protein
MRRVLSILLVLSLSVWPLVAQIRQLPSTDPPPQPLINYEASNGFVITVIVHDDHRDVVGADRYGESVTMHIKAPTSSDLRVETWIGDATLRSQHLNDGTIDWIELQTPDRTLRHNVLAEQLTWAEQETAGIVSDVPPELRTDTRVYQELAAYGHGLASEGFWQDYDFAGNEFKAQFDVMPAGCWWSCTGCVLSLAGVGISLATLIAACGATWGAGCWLTLIGMQAGKAAVVLGCTNCFQCVATPTTKEDDDGNGVQGRPINF